ncbi:hypothetical protein LIX60_10735 [Streptomyces sp. S07_1.15]|uniref:hypothetical protein n=1 Tax=Streptomyces sp. S07_1.15 TaxID=2873925 RepID=UPI001D142BD1|nr:hypothetical protein [Streptomyces sp. S07_1.15]MCC3651935.1 hypothetical protein [Streptomyces sp. S07_1.15]
MLDGRIRMRRFDESSGPGHPNGVTSTINSEGRHRSSHFGDSVKQMFDDQGGAAQRLPAAPGARSAAAARLAERAPRSASEPRRRSLT